MRLGRLVFPAVAFALGTWVGVRHAGPSGDARAADASPTTATADGRAAGRASPNTAAELAGPDPSPWPRQNPECAAHRAWLVAEGPATVPGDGRRLVTFTFDDGPHPETTPAVLRVLDAFRVKATFFFVGSNLRGTSTRVRDATNVARRVMESGHTVGGHGFAHVALPFVTRTRALGEIDDGLDAVEKATGKRPALFRPPYGQLDAFSEDALRARGLELVLWSIAADDQTEPGGLFASLRDQLAYAGGGIVLLHDIRPVTAPALRQLLGWLRTRAFDPSKPEHVGYEVVDLVTYLRATAGRPQPYEDRTTLEKARAAAWRAAHPAHAPPATGTGEDA